MFYVYYYFRNWSLALARRHTAIKVSRQFALLSIFSLSRAGSGAVVENGWTNYKSVIFKVEPRSALLVQGGHERLPGCESHKHDNIMAKWNGLLRYHTQISSGTHVSAEV